MAVTMKDIAKIIGISRQAVAAALNETGSSKVSPETQARVRRIAESLCYVPNQNARSLRGGASKTIGIYGVPYASTLNQIQFHQFSLALDACGYNLIAGYGIGEEASEVAIRHLLSRGVDGVIVTTQDNPLVKWKLTSVPYVFCPPAQAKGYDVVVDHVAGTEEAMRKIIATGRKSTVFLAPVKDGFYAEPAREKFRGICNVLKELDIQPVMLTVEECDGRGEVLLARLRELSPEILFCSNDYYAGRIMRLMLDAGIRIPDDMMVVGYDGLALCDLCPVPLSTVVQPLNRVAKAVVDLLLQRIESSKKAHIPAGIRIPSYFYPSASCGFANEKINKLPLFNSNSSLEENWSDLY